MNFARSSGEPFIYNDQTRFTNGIVNLDNIIEIYDDEEEIDSSFSTTHKPRDKYIYKIVFIGEQEEEVFWAYQLEIQRDSDLMMLRSLVVNPKFDLSKPQEQ